MSRLSVDCAATTGLCAGMGPRDIKPSILRDFIQDMGQSIHIVRQVFDLFAHSIIQHKQTPTMHTLSFLLLSTLLALTTAELPKANEYRDGDW